MNSCIFCEIDTNKIENTIIEETKYFKITPAVGSLVEGYLLIISKRHITSMSQLNDNELKEYLLIIEKYRTVFKEIYGKFPIIFEHGTVDETKSSSSSVIHAHTHIVNHNYLDESSLLKALNFSKINNILDFKEINKNYIFYINPQNTNYITFKFKPISQMMRILIAKDLNIEHKYDWTKDIFMENIEKTINKFKIKQ